ncbi:MAG: chemotaxis protein CheY [Thiotrichales bacterium SG8_50]|jgi:twitching motility two-component system response regulator PilH|nr:MAG: chemotaxis protein CheY [Thiotrichales bacterium SG8_50]
MAKILVVDDSPTMLSATKKILESGGHQVISAASGEEGIEKAASEKPALICMDVVMPGMSGFEATRKITTGADTKDIPVIILTTKDQETDRVWAKRQGAADFFIKPPDEVALLDRIHSLIG